jgi:glycosyltransferase involved in cell wall biosynthesis
MEERIPTSPPHIPPLKADTLRPLWSVMIPTYNCYAYIKEAIESVLIQYPGPELMQIEVVDDYSTDGDVKALVEELGKGRVSFYQQPQNRGSLRNFETCINRAKGHYIHILHGDDKVEAGFYNEIESLFSNYPEADASFTNIKYIDQLSRDTGILNRNILTEPGIIPDFLYQIAKKTFASTTAIVVKRSVYEALGSFYAVLCGEDWEMWARIASKYQVAYSPARLASYRVTHSTSITYYSFYAGQNIIDLPKVIDIIQGYLPEDKRKKLKSISLTYHAIYLIKIANILLADNRKMALKHVNGALKMSKDLSVCFWACRFYLMYIFRYKQIVKLLKKA